MEFLKQVYFKIERFWNLVYYFCYRVDYQFHLFFNHLNPARAVVRGFTSEEKEAENKKITDKVFKDPDNGLSAIRAGFPLAIIMFCFELVPLIISEYYNKGFLGDFIKDRYTALIYMLIPMLIFNTILCYWKNKYVKYFKKFDNKPKARKWKWAFICLGFVIISISIPILMFKYLL